MALPESDSPLLDNEKLLTRLKHCMNLPSPPGVAARIIELGQDLHAGMGDVAEVVALDPALTAKMLRMANSPMYARQRKTENLRQAIMMFGMNGTLNLALSFSLVNTFRAKEKKGIDYGLFWRRSLAAATCCRLLGVRLQSTEKEEFFLAALLQDVGILALDKAVPELYQSVDRQSDHQHVIEIEKAALDADHAAVGAWLLALWNLPQRLFYGVACSHDPAAIKVNEDVETLVRCVAVSGVMADIWCRENEDQQKHALREAVGYAQKLLDMDQDTVLKVLDTAGLELQETSTLFEVELGDTLLIESLLDRAKEILIIRNIQTTQEVSNLRTSVEALESKTSELEEDARRDGLTGLYNRAHLDKVLREEFESALRHSWPLPAVFVDLDHFKRVNDTHGHHIGDKVLQSSAKLLLENTRDTDIVARYGGEEFVILLIGTHLAGARVTCERIVTAFGAARHNIDHQGDIAVTASIGVAVLSEGIRFNNPEELLQAADEALFTAKKQGRNQYVVFEPDFVIETGD